MISSEDMEKVKKVLEDARQEYRSAPHGAAAVGYKYPNYVDGALLEVQYGQLLETQLLSREMNQLSVSNHKMVQEIRELSKETKVLRLLTWGLLILTASLAAIAFVEIVV